METPVLSPGYGPVLARGAVACSGEPHVRLIALLANNLDVKWVMGQVGHADAKMTMDVYAALEQRLKRGHGASFDRLVSQAPELRVEYSASAKAAELAPKDTGPKSASSGRQRRVRLARLGIDQTTPRFSAGQAERRVAPWQQSQRPMRPGREGQGSRRSYFERLLTPYVWPDQRAQRAHAPAGSYSSCRRIQS